MNESQAEYGWEEAGVPGKGKAYKGNSSLCLPVLPTVSDLEGGNGSEMARQEAKAAKLVYWHTQ